MFSFTLIFFLSFLAFIVGMINPQWVITKLPQTRSSVALLYIGLMISSMELSIGLSFRDFSEMLIDILVQLSVLALIVGIFSPRVVLPKFVPRNRGIVILFYFSLSIIIPSFWTSYKEYTMTPEEKLAETTRIEQERVERQQQRALRDSLQTVQRQIQKDAVIVENEISAPDNTFQDTKKGDFVRNSNTFTIEVLKVKDKKSIANIAERGYGKYRYFTVKITNNTKVAQDIYRRDFYLVSETGEIYQSNSTQSVISFFTTLRRDAFGVGEALAPKVPAKGVLAFEIPEGEIKYKLIYKGC